MTKDETMKLALEALEFAAAQIYNEDNDDIIADAIAALRQALDQPECNPHPDAPHGFNRESSHSLGRYVCDCEGWEPEEQEPVAWWNPRYGKGEYAFADSSYPIDFGWDIPLYTAPPKRKWVGLTDEEIAEGANQSWVDKQAFESAVWWAEKKLKDKNRG